MDPLSIAASIAGLLTLTVQVIETCDTLYATVKKRPKIFKALSEDLKSLTRVLSDLAKIDVSKAEGEEDAFRQCVDGCDGVLKELQSEFDALKALFKGNIMVKTYAQITFKSKMDSILESRGQVERYTHTLSLALLLRQNASSAIIIARLNQIHGELSQAQKQTGRPTTWLNPMQRYVEASASVVSTANSSSSSLTGATSGSTLVDGDASQKGTHSVTSRADADAINSYGTYSEWLESFMQPDVNEGQSPAHETGRGTVTESPARSRDLSDSPRPVEIRVTGLPKGDGVNSQTSALTLHLEHSDFWDQALKLLNQKGYRKICGFKIGGVLIPPLRAHLADVRLTVTKGPSVYSMAKGLRINVDEPLQLYFDTFVRVGETGSGIPPLSLNYSLDEGKVVVVDYFGNMYKNVEIAFNRTLRVPENGTVYNPPAFFSPFPLINVEELKSNSLPQLGKKGGLIIPLFQREALALSFVGETPRNLYEKPSADFAIRIYAGSVNTVTGETHQQSESDAQDYVVVPVQHRLDGFLVRAGIVKQFVSMPLGSGYTAESQVTGREVLGGLQMLIAPRFRARGTFKGHTNQRLTPREIGLPPGDTLLISGAAVESRATEFRLAEADTYFTGEGAIFHRFTECRPVFVHEIIAQFSAPGMLREPLSVHPVLPYKIEIQIRKPKEYVYTSYTPRKLVALHSMSCKSVQLPREYSPFLGVNDFAELTAELLEVEEVVMFLSDGRELQRPPTYLALHEVIADGTVLECQGYAWRELYGAAMPWKHEKQIQPKEELQWDMGLVPGGEIRQEIVPDPDPLEWNWKRARLVNIQILNSVVFESMTNICPPPPPISYKDYINARLPFFHTIEGESVAETSMLRSIKSVGEQDRSIDVSFQVSMQKDHHKVTGCVVCEKNLADSILKPCKHVFCGLCIRDSMHEGVVIRCAACRKPANGLVTFAAPMELPFVTTKSSKSEDNRTTLDMKDSASDEALAKAEGKAITLLQKLTLRGGRDVQVKTESLVLHGLGINEPIAYENGRTAMQIAASSGNSDLVARFIKAGIDVNEAPCGVDGRSALQAAAEKGHHNVVSQLLSAGANPNGPVSPVRGCSALEAAAGNGHLAILAQLLMHGAMTTSDSCRKSALHVAAENGNEAVVALLLAYGCDPNITVDLSMEGPKPDDILRWEREDFDVSPSRLAAENGHLSVLKLLRKHGAKEKPISAACTHGHLEIVSWFLDCEAEHEATQNHASPGDLEEQDSDDERTNDSYDILLTRKRKRVDDYGYEYRDGIEGLLDVLVETAVEHGQLEILKMLVSRGAWLRDPRPQRQQPEKRAKSFYRSTSLHEAAKNGYIEVVEYLLSAGFDVDEPRVYRETTPLMEAARGGQDKVFKLLVEHGADIGAQDQEGHPIIIGAAQGGSIEIMTLLIDLGMDPTTTSIDLVSPLSTALEHKQRPLADFLLDKLATVDDDLGHCYGGALRMAACHGYVGIVRELLRRGADANFGNPRNPSTSLSRLGNSVDAETNEADCLKCARALVAAGGKLRGVNDVLRHLDRQEKPALAAFLLENCLDDSNTSGVDWIRHIKNAAEKSHPKLLKLLVSQLGLVHGSEQDSWRFWDDVRKAADAGQFQIVDILLQASSPEVAKNRARAAIRSLGLGQQDHMRQYLERRYMMELVPVRENRSGSG